MQSSYNLFFNNTAKETIPNATNNIVFDEDDAPAVDKRVDEPAGIVVIVPFAFLIVCTVLAALAKAAVAACTLVNNDVS